MSAETLTSPEELSTDQPAAVAEQDIPKSRGARLRELIGHPETRRIVMVAGKAAVGGALRAMNLLETNRRGATRLNIDGLAALSENPKQVLLAGARAGMRTFAATAGSEAAMSAARGGFGAQAAQPVSEALPASGPVLAPEAMPQGPLSAAETQAAIPKAELGPPSTSH